MALDPIITEQCRIYFGTHKQTKAGKKLVGNRCDQCPLRSPCLKFGTAPARTLEDLHRSRDEFAAEAREILK